MSSEFERRMAARPCDSPELPKHVIWRLTKNGRHAEARMLLGREPIGNPDLCAAPTPAFQLLWSKLDRAVSQAAKALVSRLFEAVFRGEVAHCLAASQAYAAAHDVGLRLRLRLGNAALADFPWEFLRSPGGV